MFFKLFHFVWIFYIFFLNEIFKTESRFLLRANIKSYN